ncbi:MAG: AMP-binding protein [Calditrichaceae bacterium]
MFLKDHGKTALVWKDLKISYETLVKNVDYYSGLFESAKTKKVAIFAENSLDWVYAFYASWKNDCIAVPIDYMSTSDEVAYILNDCKPEIIFCSNETYKTVESALQTVTYDQKVLKFEDIDIRNAPSVNSVFPEPDKDKTALIIYTSGTTGSPKGVMLSFDNILANVEAVSDYVNIYTSDRNVMVLLPLHHTFPLIGSMIAPLSVGSTIAFAPSMAAEDIMETLQNNAIAIIIGVPRFYNLIRKGIMDKINKSAVTKTLFKLAEKIDSRAFSKVLFKTVQQKFGGNVHFMVCGGAAIDDEVARDYKTLGFEILPGYGMTEAAPMISFTRPGRWKIGSAGERMMTNEIRITDEGEITAKGRNVMQGYYNRKEETDEILKDGWLYTGDLGRLDKDGHLVITGRKKEIIILPNGKNVNPVEVEFKILNMSAYINEIGVFLKGDTLQAAIYPDFARIQEDGLLNIEEIFRQEIINKYNSQVSPYKRITNFSILKEELPKTRLGKVKRFMLPSLSEDTRSERQRGEEPDFEEYKIIKQFLNEEAGREVYHDDHIEIDLGLDSLGKVSLQVFLNSTFGVDIKEEEFMQYPTIEKLALVVRDEKVKIDVETVNWGDILREKLDINLPKSWFTHNLFKNTSRVFLNLYFRLKGEGTENLPESPFILAPNHQSFFDGLFVVSFLKNKQMKKTYFYAKEKHVSKKWLKFIADRNNVIIMDINKDLKISLQKMAAALKKGKNIIIFPEGTRSKDGHIGSFKKTFAILSRELNVPVVPVTIRGAFEALPSGSHFPKPFKKIFVKFHSPVYPENHTYESLKEAVYQKMSKYLG